MKKQILVTLLLVGAFILTPVFTYAQTRDQLINQFLVQIAELQRQLAILQGQQNQVGSWCHTFNTNLSIGLSGSEVTALQTALTRAGFSTSASGNFDEATASAVSSFQLKYKSEILTANGLTYPTGYFGPATRRKMNQLYGCNNVAIPLTTPPPISRNPTEKKYAVLLINFDSNPVEPVTKEDVNKFYFDQSNPKSLSSYYKEVSYGAMNLVGDIYGYYTLAYSQISPYSGCGYSVDDVHNYIKAINDVNFAKYDGVILMIASKAGCSNTIPNGLRRIINTTSGNKEIGVVYNFIDNPTRLDLISNQYGGDMPHELGHSLGLRHSSYLDCRSTTITENIFRDCKILNFRVTVGCPVDNPMCSGCSAGDQACINNNAKGDLFDLMGSGLGGLSVYQREKVGFLLDRQINVVKSSGIYTIEPRGANTSGVKAIKIPLREHSGDGNDKDFYYYIEYVRPIGADKILSSSGVLDRIQSTNADLNGAFVHLVNPNGLLSLIPGYQDYDDQAILDMSPHSNADMNIYENIKDVVLKTGQTFKDEKRRISIKTIDVQDDKLVVEVNFW